MKAGSDSLVGRGKASAEDHAVMFSELKQTDLKAVNGY
jgi:hypothetical protein